MTMGADPEVFVLDESGTPVPAWLFFPNKENKIPGPKDVQGHIRDKGAFFRDGYALEFNLTPGTCRALMSNEMGVLLNMAKSHLPKGYTLTTKTTVKVDQRTLGDVPPDCQIFGCDPSIDAYTGQERRPDVDPLIYPCRHAGAHMHTSFSTANREDRLFFIKTCDLFIGLVDAYFFDSDDERLRRKIYGRAGECRLPEYETETLVEWGIGDRKDVYETTMVPGVEYRVPCSQLWNDHRLAGLMFGVMRTLLGKQQQLKKQWRPEWEPEIQRQINECKVDPKWLQTVPEFYTPELLKAIKESGEFHKFNMLEFGASLMPKSLTYRSDAHTGYGDWLANDYKLYDMIRPVYGKPINVTTP